ncbi:MAG: DHH family phosphoesterase [Candidatus Kariarchaeaceae archaeon]|jgi:oligoribonuclease NrnB/cAMP/cGMP phosphodiesterase (DHH superfamily)
MCAAAIVKSVYHGAEVFFSRAPQLHKDIRELEKYMKQIDVLYILDVALNPKNLQFTLERLKKSKLKSEIYYFDNHIIPEFMDRKDLETHVTKYRNEKFYSTAATTFITLYGNTEEIIVNNRRQALLGAYGSISDYAKNCPFLATVNNIWDESSIQFQAFLLKQASRIIRSDDLKRTIVDKLSVGILPSEIAEVDKAARDASREIDVAIPFIKKNAIKIGDVGVIYECPVASMGHNAYVTATMTNSRIGIAIKKNGEYARLVLRKRKSELIHLGDLASKVGKQLEIDGGGEMANSGLTCPSHLIDEVIQLIDQMLTQL